MIVKELIEKLQAMPPDAVVAWDSHDVNYWYGEEVELEATTKEEILETIFDEEGNMDDLLPDDMTHVVVLR